MKRDHNLRYDCKMKIMIYNTQLGIYLAEFSIDTRFESWDNGVKNSSHQKIEMLFPKEWGNSENSRQCEQCYSA